MYEELAKRIRGCSYSDPNGCEECRACPNADNYYECKQKLALQAADAIEELSKRASVVRCKDCKNRFNYGICANRGDNWFCADGERRDGDGDG